MCNCSTLLPVYHKILILTEDSCNKLNLYFNITIYLINWVSNKTNKTTFIASNQKSVKFTLDTKTLEMARQVYQANVNRPWLVATISGCRATPKNFVFSSLHVSKNIYHLSDSNTLWKLHFGQNHPSFALYVSLFFSIICSEPTISIFSKNLPVLSINRTWHPNDIRKDTRRHTAKEAFWS